MLRSVPAVIALTAVVATGVVHGFWTDRWGVGEKVQHAVDSLEKVPMKVGDWVGEEREGSRQDLQGLPGQRSLRYTNQKTSDVILLDLFCGRPGKVSIHTPDVCYASSGFKVSKQLEYEVKGVAGEPRFYTADMTPLNVASNENKSRLFWAWRSGGRWQVAENPRFRFAGQPVLFKFYLARELTADGPVGDDEPCVKFLRLLLPELDRVLDDGSI